MSTASRDPNRVPTLIGVSNADSLTPTKVAVDPATGEMLVQTTLSAGDIEIGAVEIKDGTTDARAVVGPDGLEVDVTGLVVDTDDDSVAKEQELPLVINENYIFDKTGDAWNRMQGSTDGYLFTRPIGIYTPDGDSVMDDVTNSIIISGAVTMATLPDTATGDLAAIVSALGGSLDVSGATVTVDLGANNDVTLATLPDTSAGDLADINSNTDGIETLLGGVAGFTVTGYDYIALTYVAAGNGEGEVETATFKIGGAGGSAIATLTLTYDASNRVVTVTKT